MYKRQALHPGGEVTGKLARIVAEQLPNADGHVLDRLEHHFKRSEGIGSLTFHPVAIEILEELGFDWGPDYELYRQMMLARASADWPRLIEHSAHYQEKFQNDTWYWLSMTQAYIASGSFVEAKLSHSKLVELCPGNLQTWMLGLSLYQKFGDRVDIDGLIHRASSFFQGQRIFSQMMAFFHLKLGDAFAAEPYARDYHARTPDRADALVPLLMTLRFLDRLPEVRDIIEYERSIATPARLSEIEANLAGTEFEQYIASGAADQQRLSLAVRA